MGPRGRPRRYLHLGLVADRRHSRNVGARPEVSIVVFNSQVAVGSVLAVYMSARAEELAGAALEGDLAVFDTASQAQGLYRRRCRSLGPRSRQQSRRPRRGRAVGRVLPLRGEALGLTLGVSVA